MLRCWERTKEQWWCCEGTACGDGLPGYLEVCWSVTDLSNP